MATKVRKSAAASVVSDPKQRASKRSLLGANLPLVGSDVVVSIYKSRLTGKVSFAGPTSFSPGDWLGIALEEAKGKNDGTVQGIRYFECTAGHGIFVRPAAVVSVLSQPPSDVKGSKGNDQGANRATDSTASRVEERWRNITLKYLHEDTRKNVQTSFEAYALSVKHVVAEIDIQVAETPNAVSGSASEVRRALAEACEDHNGEAVKRLLPRAIELGVAQTEIQGASRLLHCIDGSQFEIRPPLQDTVEEFRQICDANARRMLAEMERAGQEQLAELRAMLAATGCGADAPM